MYALPRNHVIHEKMNWIICQSIVTIFNKIQKNVSLFLLAGWLGKGQAHVYMHEGVCPWG